MSNTAPKHTLSDLMAEAVSPVLIVALVGSLIFFLVEVLYVGEYPGNLLWGLFFFVFAAVLIARISIAEPGKARTYGLILAVPVWLTLQFYVEYPPNSPLADLKAIVHVVLMAIVWWCAHRLTWDCTFIEEGAEVTGTGLLQAAGLERPLPERSEVPAEAEGTGEDANLDWWQRFRRYREQRRKKHTPGVWVVYFSLAALPLFGLGQSLIPVEDESRRRYVFWLMVIYVASGLGLLLTTTFLGLRHYLKRRQVKVPAAITGVWLTMGGGLVAALLVLGAVLPRPQAEYPLIDLARIGSPKRSASQFAVKDGSPGEGEGRRSASGSRGDQTHEDESGDRGRTGGGERQASGENQDAGGKQGKNGSGTGNSQGKKGGEGERGQSRGGSSQGGQQRSAPGPDGDSRNRSGGREGRRDTGGSQQGRTQERQRPGQRQNEGGRQPQREQTGQAPEPGRPAPPSHPPMLAGLWSFLAALMPILKWIVYIAFFALVAFVILRAVLQFLANFTTWARDLLKAWRAWWQALFGWMGRGRAEGDEAGDAVPATPPRPFSSYANPFRDGSAARLRPEKLVRYTFAAFQAWAYEQHLGRRPDETPLEFAARVGMEVPGMETDAGRLATLFARALYARGPLPADTRAAVEQFWERLEAVVEQPLSA
jgi:hypothetical protein